MEETSVDVEVKLPNKVDEMVYEDENKVRTNGDSHRQSKEGSREENEEESSLDEEFIKVERELIDVKENLQPHKPMSQVEETSCFTNIYPSSKEPTNSSELEEKIKALELQVENVTKKLQESESENALLKSKADFAKGELEKKMKYCEELEHDRDRMKEQMSETEQENKLHLQSLEEASGTLNTKDKALNVAEQRHGELSTELENSRKKIMDLEIQLTSSLGEASKYEALSNEKSSNAELASQRVLELENMLEVVKVSLKEMEDQNSSLQEQMKGLLVNIAENQTLENLLSASREEIQAKVANLEEVELKLQEEIMAREVIEASLKDEENKSLILQEEFEKLTGEKETLQSNASDLNTHLVQAKELCIELKTKLNLAEEKLGRSDSLLSQTLSQKEELDEKLKSLEGLVQESNAAEEGLKAQLRESETRRISTEERNVGLEQQLALLELKCANATRETEELYVKTAELTTLLRESEEESDMSKCRFQAFEDRVGQLESSLKISYSRNSQLENELKDIADKCTEHEGRATSTHQRSLELEELVHRSHSKAEDTEKRVSELELLLEDASYRNKELERLASNAEAKYRDAERESKFRNGMISELSTELELFQTRAQSLEDVLQAASGRERELTDMLSARTEETKKFEDMSNSSSEKLLQAEILIEDLHHELQSVREKLDYFEKDLEASGIREIDLLEKLKSAEEQLEYQLREADQANTRSLELEQVHKSLVKDSELQLQEAAVNLSQKDSEAKQLDENLKSLEEQLASHQNQAIESADKVASLTAELEGSATKLAALENTIEELKIKISEAEAKVEQSMSESDLLGGTNSKLREELAAQQCKVSELHELLSSTQSEKEAASEQLASHTNTISKLTEEHSRGLELHSAKESRVKEIEAQLHEATERLAQRDSEAGDLKEQVVALQNQMRISEEQVCTVTSLAENRKVELEDALLNLQKLEGFVEEIQSKVGQCEAANEGLIGENLSLSQELKAWEIKWNGSEMTLNAVIAEKEAKSLQLHDSRKTVEDLTQQLASDGEKFQSQISSVMEDINSTNQAHQDTKKELEAVKAQMEEQINEHKAREISLGADLSEKSRLHDRISELEQELISAENRYKKEVERVAAEKETILSGKQDERDALVEQLKELQKELTEQDAAGSKRLALANSEMDGLRVKLGHAVDLEAKIAELESKLQAKDGNTVTESMEVKSREVEFDAPQMVKRKSKKRREGSGTGNQAVAAATADAEPTGAMAFKFILGVALVSVIIGVFLGKRF